MSYNSYFGAYVVPAETRGYLSDIEQTKAEFGGSSRSEWFQRSCGALLNSAPGHDLLRFLSVEAWSAKFEAHGGEMTFTTISSSRARFVIGQLDDLLMQCEERSGEWVTLLGTQGESTEMIVEAARSRAVFQDLNQATHFGEEGQTTLFAVTALGALYSTMSRVCATDEDLVYFTWR